jgi:hypothetical protein
MEAVEALAAGFDGIALDLNTYYFLQGRQDWSSQLSTAQSLGWRGDTSGCTRGRRIGMLDTTVMTAHPALAGQDISTRNFLPAGVDAAPADHGTAVATLLVASNRVQRFAGLLPEARLLAGEVFRQDDERSFATVEWLLLGLDWLASQRAEVVNLSLGGTRNRVLEAALGKIIAQGAWVVAAAGLSASGDQPLFPANLPGVIAVTAVDADFKVPRDAPGGDYIAFAAPGIDIWAGTADGGGQFHRGSSFASPYVSAALIAAGDDAYNRLVAGATDLGPPGRDAIYGAGLVQFPGACSQRQ